MLLREKSCEDFSKSLYLALEVFKEVGGGLFANCLTLALPLSEKLA